MKPLFVNLFAAVAGLGFATGCTNGHENDETDNGATPAKAADTIAKGSAQMDKSQASLDDLVAHPQPDRRRQLATFAAAVNALGTTAAEIARDNRMRKNQAVGYFMEWDREITASPKGDARARSEIRRDQAAARFSRLTKQYDETGAFLAPYMSDLRDVEKTMTGALPDGDLANARAGTAKAIADAVPAKESLARLSIAVGAGGNILER